MPDNALPTVFNTRRWPCTAPQALGGLRPASRPGGRVVSRAGVSQSGWSPSASLRALTMGVFCRPLPDAHRAPTHIELLMRESERVPACARTLGCRGTPWPHTSKIDALAGVYTYRYAWASIITTHDAYAIIYEYTCTGGYRRRYARTSVARQLCTSVSRMWQHFPGRPCTQSASLEHCLLDEHCLAGFSCGFARLSRVSWASLIGL